MIDAVENMTGKSMPKAFKDKFNNGVEEIDLIRSGLDDMMREAYQKVRAVMIESKIPGLGLSIAQDIVRMHGGTISHERKEGSTIFSVVVPIESQLLAEQVNA